MKVYYRWKNFVFVSEIIVLFLLKARESTQLVIT